MFSQCVASPRQGKPEGVVSTGPDALLARTLHVVRDGHGGPPVQQHLQDLEVVPEQMSANKVDQGIAVVNRKTPFYFPPLG